MAGVHRLQQVEHFGSAHLADDDALGPHAQAVLDEVAHGHLALAFKIGRARFEAHHMRLLQLQFGRVLAGDDALVAVDIVGQAVEQRRLAGTGAAGDDDVAAHAADDLQHLGAFLRDRAEPDELVEGQLVLLELADGERGAIDCERRRDHVDARAVRQARIADRARFVDAPADLADDALADIEKLLVVAEADAGLLDLAVDLDIDRLGAVDHDVGDVVARQQRLQRTIAQHVVADVFEQFLLLGDRHREILDRDDVVDDVADFLACAFGFQLGELRQVDRVDQRRKHLRLGVVVGFAALALLLARLGASGGASTALRPIVAAGGDAEAGRCSAGRACSAAFSAGLPTAAGGVTAGRNSGAARTPSSLPLLPNMIDYHRRRPSLLLSA